MLFLDRNVYRRLPSSWEPPRGKSRSKGFTRRTQITRAVPMSIRVRTGGLLSSPNDKVMAEHRGDAEQQYE